VSYLREVDASGQPVFCTILQNHQWTSCSANVAAGTSINRVLNLMVRVFVPSGYAYKGGVHLDSSRRALTLLVACDSHERARVIESRVTFTRLRIRFESARPTYST
jgi:hypothetical protein